MTTEKFKEEIREIEGIKVRITSYKIGNEFYCHVYVADPGATIARATGSTENEAVQKAVEKATVRLSPVGKRH